MLTFKDLQRGQKFRFYADLTPANLTPTLMKVIIYDEDFRTKGGPEKHGYVYIDENHYLLGHVTCFNSDLNEEVILIQD